MKNPYFSEIKFEINKSNHLKEGFENNLSNKAIPILFILNNMHNQLHLINRRHSGRDNNSKILPVHFSIRKML